MTAFLSYTIPEPGDAKPTGLVQFGDKYFCFGADWRPFYLQPGPDVQKLVGYPAGIKPPTLAPTLAFNATNATNIGFNAQFPQVYISYSFYSRGRVIPSQMSPVATITLTNPPKQIVVSGFQDPRDNATSCAIDTILINVQLAINNGLMNTGSNMWVDCSDGNFTGKNYVFDLSGATLELGYNASIADPYLMIPPAVKYAAKGGNRLWMGGTRGKVAFSASTVTVTANQTFRLTTPVAEVVISGDVWNDSLYNMTLVVNGKVLGDVFDVGGTGNVSTVLYIDRDVAANISATDDFYFLGYNDRLFAGSFIDATLGSIPTTYTECVSLLPGVVQILTPALDGAKNIIGVTQSRGVIYAMFPDCAQPILGGDDVNIPLPVLQENFGKTGPAADRSYAIDPDGNILFIGQEGIISLNTAQMINICAQLECLKLFKGSIWIALADLPSIVQVYARSVEGLVLGNFTINGDANWWGLMSYAPQKGFWLFSGQEITTNIFEYTGSDGNGVVVCGDSFNGRFKRLLDPATYLDVQPASDTPAAYNTRWRPGYQVAPIVGSKYMNPATVEFPGALVPSGTCALTVNQVWSNFPQRNLALVPSSNKAARPVAFNDLQWQRCTLSPGQARFYSLEVAHMSDSGLAGGVPMQIPRYVVKTQGDPQ